MTRRVRTSLVLSWSILIVTGLGCRPAPPGPPQQVAYLKASNPGTFHHFGEGDAISFHTGNAVAISADGTTIAVGAQHERSTSRGVNGDQRIDSAYDAGAVYVFTGGGSTWTQQAYIKASNAESGDHFGNNVALSADGNTLAVAAYWEASAATGVNGNQADNSLPQAGACTSSREAAGPGASRPFSRPPIRVMQARVTSPATATSSARRSRSAATATPSRSARSPKTATPRRSMATRKTTQPRPPARSTSSRGRARPGRSRRTSRLRRRPSSRTAICSAIPWPSTQTATCLPSAPTTKADRQEASARSRTGSATGRAPRMSSSGPAGPGVTRRTSSRRSPRRTIRGG
ncbi:MAG: hypothetical protein HOP16_03085 [Acidobacteria bacterium]|nr:hypothetical protein [Acidobacteriota bacterium]